ncbi:MAG TPA: esterase, partial [Pseudomonas sp.]|nr:esterase [Pseudomonas sp.]
ASVVLAETVGSTASYQCIDPKRFYCVGLEVNANHIRALRSGRVTAVCRPVHLGRSSHVWDIRLSGDDGKLSCISRLTVAVMPLGEDSPRRIQAS